MRAKEVLGAAALAVLAGVRVGAMAGEPPLVRAAREGNTTQVRALLLQRVEVDQAGPDGTTALHWAARRDDVETVSLLIRIGANAKLTNRYGVTPLLLACETGSLATAEALLGGGADPNGALPEGETPLMVAARSGKTDVLKLLVASGARVDARESWHGQDALMWAAAEGHASAIKALVEMGADVKARTPGGFTALLFASRAGSVHAVRTLVELGADVNDALQPAPKPGAARRTPAPPPVATAATAAGATNNAANVGGGLRPSGDGSGTTALILAVANRHWTLAKFLVEQGADPNDARGGWTALHELSYMRRPNMGKGLPPPEEVEHIDTLELARVLIAHGADVNARQTSERRDGSRNELNRVGATPLLLAAKHADVPLMRFLAAHGADPTIPTGQNTTLLMAAAGVGVFNVGESAGTNDEALEATKLAYELGSTDINAADANGWTALHGAAKRGANPIVQFLADHGTGFEAKTNTEGWTALRIADGVLVGGTIKRADETAALIRTLMKERGIEPPPKVVNDVAEVERVRRP